MSSSVSNATTTTRTISMYSHSSHEFGSFGKTKENTLNEEINCYFKRRSNSWLDVSGKLFPKESIYSCDSFELRGSTLDTERESDSLKSSSTSLPVTRSISRCRDGYWITTDPDFVVLDLSWDDSYKRI